MYSTFEQKYLRLFDTEMIKIIINFFYSFLYLFLYTIFNKERFIK